MRIIGGRHKGRILKVPNGLEVRPTTDFAKEALFNILYNRLNFETLSVLDLFSGTGHISFEFASREAKEVISVDENFKCMDFQRRTAELLQLNINTIKSDVFSFIKNTHLRFDLIFADPPYMMENIPEIHSAIFEKGILNQEGLLIIEHGPKTDLSLLKGFIERRKYGNVNFSFFENKPE